jgi:galactokinase
VRGGEVEEFQRAVAQGYERATGRKPDIYIVHASDGVREALE